MFEASVRPIKIAILAMGGEGGGVLADWIVSAAEHQGFYAQSTSVPGVAQRTGATIYYVEILPVQRQRLRTPILGLMPVPGDVDVVLASELMEAARAVQRGLVTADKTILIASSNRVYTLTEKMAMGDGRQDYASLYHACETAAKTFVCQDFAALAAQQGSVISATLFGALAASGSLPWDRQAFEGAIERGGVGVRPSLAAFGAGFIAYGAGAAPVLSSAPFPAQTVDQRLSTLATRIDQDFPEPVREVLRAGIARAADYQHPAYAASYLDQLERIRDVDQTFGDGSWRLLSEAARHLALWMTYEDTARVAELKIRRHRFQRIRDDHGVSKGQMLRINEFFHPRLDEIADTLPAGLGRWLLRSRWARSWVERSTRKGRIIRTSSLRGFLLLYSVSAFKRVRPRSLRYERECAAMQNWLDTLQLLVPQDYELACEVALCQQLIKGYGDTHARGMRSYELIMGALATLRGQPDAAATVARLRAAALADDSGAQLRSGLADFAPAAPVLARED